MQSTANERYVKWQVSVIRAGCAISTFRWNTDMRRQWSVRNIGWSEKVSGSRWEKVINDHCHRSVGETKLFYYLYHFSNHPNFTPYIAKWRFCLVALGSFEEEKMCCLFVTVAKKKSLFDDKSEEIQQLTYIVKQDISSLNKQIAQLQEVSKTSGVIKHASLAIIFK